MLDQHAHPSILTVTEVAHYLRVSETTIWRWCSSGRLPAFRVGRAWRVRRTDLDSLISGRVPADDLSHPGAPSPQPAALAIRADVETGER